MKNLFYFFTGALTVWFILHILITQVKGIGVFLTLHTKSVNSIKHTRKEMIEFTLKLWLFIFFVAFFSFDILWYATLLMWVYIIYFGYYFVKLWKFHGYSSNFLVISTSVVVILSFFLTTFLRNSIYSVIQPYLF